MKNLKYKVIISILAFVMVAVATFVVTRVAEEEQSTRSVMGDAGLPLVYMVSEGGNEYNLLHGYVTNIDESMLHECITPLPEDRRLTIRVLDYGQTITGISYEIRSLDGKEFLESTDVTEYISGEEYTEAVLNIKNLLNKDEQYMLKIIVRTPEKTASYYTRIVHGGDLMLDEKLEYVLHFSEVTYDDEAINEIIPKLEPDSTGDNTNLGHVNIHSKLSQVGWGQLTPIVATKVWPTIAEIEGNVADIRLEYQVTTKAAGGGMDWYDVVEFFRIRRADETTTYVLGYERYVDQIFDGEDDLNDSGRIYLGITSGLEGDMQLVSDSAGKITCFVRRGELWSYNAKSNQFVRIFSFMDDDTKYDSIRESYDQHGIKIMNVSSDGSVDFVVYGYMNRGAHEGEMGVSVCSYNAENNSVNEILYVPRNEIYDIIKLDVERLVYLNDEGRFFMYQGGYIYSIDCDTKEYMVVSENAIDSTCVFSEENAVFAYQEGGNADNCEAINIIQLKTGETGRIEAGQGRYIKTLGLIDGNMIYGRAYKIEGYLDERENWIYPMYKLEIADSEYNIVKEYEKNNIRITSVEADDNKIIIERMQYNSEGILEPASEDQLLSKEVASEEGLYVKQVATDVRQKESYIMLTGSVPDSALTKVVNAKPAIFDAGALIYMSETSSINQFYMVYGLGKLKLLTENLTEAIKSANEWAGVVVDSDGSIIWDRYKPAVASVNPEEGCNLEKKLDITGCNLDEALYYIEEGMLLRIKAAADNYLIVYGYDKTNVYAFNEASGEALTYTRTELAAISDSMGNIIFVYEQD